ncbi:MAG: hypothetical protein M1433_03055 [Candidatus Parvarchaeota archaeon]|nr:hypothetical protein [Candidatus Parvarchaeota archaeon]
MSLLDAFKKKEPGEVPDVTDMVKNGMSDQDIIENLRQQGYDSTAIKNALINASSITSSTPQVTTQQSNVSSMSPQVNSDIPQQQQTQFSTGSNFKMDQSKSQSMSNQTLDTIQQVLEQIIEEKWSSAASDFNSVKNTVKSNSADIKTVNDKIARLDQRIDSIQNTMLGKTEEYNKTISDVNVELQAFEKVIDRLVPTISDSIKELRDLVDELKSAKTN